MLVTILGGLGSGKTLLMVVLAKLSNLAVIANFKIEFPEKSVEEFNLNKFLKAEYENSIILLDEAYNYLESRISLSELNRIMSYILFQSRKKNVTIYITAQLFSTIDKRFRELSDLIVIANRKTQNFDYTIMNNQYSVNISFKYEKMLSYFSMYNTNEIVFNRDEKLSFSLQNGDEKMSQIELISNEIIEYYKKEKIETITQNLVKLYFTGHELPNFLARDCYTQIKLLKLKKEKKKKKSSSN